MEPCASRNIVTVVLVVLIIAVCVAPTAAASPDLPETEPQAASSMPGRRVIRVADNRTSSHRVPPYLPSFYLLYLTVMRLTNLTWSLVLSPGDSIRTRPMLPGKAAPSIR